MRLQVSDRFVGRSAAIGLPAVPATPSTQELVPDWGPPAAPVEPHLPGDLMEEPGVAFSAREFLMAMVPLGVFGLVVGVLKTCLQINLEFEFSETHEDVFGTFG